MICILLLLCFAVQARPEPLPSGERGRQAESPFAGTRNASFFSRLSAKENCRFGRKAACSAPGRQPLATAAAAANGQVSTLRISNEAGDCQRRLRAKQIRECLGDELGALLLKLA